MKDSKPATDQRIRVVHYCNQLGIGGTERTMEIFCKYLDRNRFEVFAVGKKHKPPILQRLKVELGALLRVPAAGGKKKLWASLNARLPNFQQILGNDHVFLAEDDQDLERLLLELKPDVLHVHYSGNPEAPTSNEKIMSSIPVVVTTNQFERENTAPSHRHVKKMFFVSNWMLQNKAKWAVNDPRAAVFYNPIEMPCSNESLRDELGIPRDAFVVGRIGRADPGIHDPIALRAFRQIERPNTYFVAISAPENMIRQAKSLSLQNFITIPPSADPVFLSKFYNTIDVLAHARRDGETFGCANAEGMIHGRPVVSHLCSFMNAQTEVIADGGYVVEQDDSRIYAAHLEELRDNPTLRAQIAARAKAIALERYEARALTTRLEKTYVELLETRSK